MRTLETRRAKMIEESIFTISVLGLSGSVLRDGRIRAKMIEESKFTISALGFSESVSVTIGFWMT